MCRHARGGAMPRSGRRCWTCSPDGWTRRRWVRLSTKEIPMHPTKACALAAIGILSGLATPALAEVVAYEGARIIVGDGRVIEKGTLVVDGAKVLQAGGGARAPPGAERVGPARPTAMPLIIDCHVPPHTPPPA